MAAMDMAGSGMGDDVTAAEAAGLDIATADTGTLLLEHTVQGSAEGRATLLAGRVRRAALHAKAPAGSVTSVLPGPGLGRRKLTDAIMMGFVVGNTSAQPLLTAAEGAAASAAAAAATAPAERAVRLLFVGVGDVRNPLSTLVNVPMGTPARLHLNDTSVVVLARNIVMLSMAVHGNDAAAAVQHAVAVWSDAELTTEGATALVATLDALLAACPPWVVPHGGVLDTLRECWRRWRAMGAQLSLAQGRERRQQALNAKVGDVGHGRVGPSPLWRQFGVSTLPPSAAAAAAAEAAVATRRKKKGKGKRGKRGKVKGVKPPPLPATAYSTTQCNPTLFHPFTGVLLDCQGPGGAFLGLDAHKPGTAPFAAALVAAWRPLLEAWRARVSTTTWHIWRDEGTSLLRGLRSMTFHAIDTSNVMDYVGMWNLLPTARCRLDAGSAAWQPFVQTEAILGMAPTLDSMLYDEAPHDPSLHYALLDAFGLSPKVLRDASEATGAAGAGTGAGAGAGAGTGAGSSSKAPPERVVRVRWVLDASADAGAIGKSAAARRKKMIAEVLALAPLGQAAAAMGSSVVATKEALSRVMGQLWERELQQLLDAQRRAYGSVFERPTEPMEAWEAKDVANGMLAALVDEWKETAASAAGGGSSGPGGDGEDVTMGASATSGGAPGSLMAATASLSETARQFQTQLYQLLQVAATPQPMTPTMMEGGDVHRPLLEGYGWPKLTMGTFVELVAQLCALPRCTGLLDGVLDRLFTVQELAQDPTASTRLLALFVQCCTRATRLAPALTPGMLPRLASGSPGAALTPAGAAGVAPSAAVLQTMQVWSVAVPRYDLAAERGGVFEPSLCAALVADDAMVDTITKASGKWVHSEETGQPINLLTALLQQTPPSRVQLLDNLLYDTTSNQFAFDLPVGMVQAYAMAPPAAGTPSPPPTPPTAPVPPLTTFRYVLLMDVQRYELVAEPVSLVAAITQAATDLAYVASHQASS